MAAPPADRATATMAVLSGADIDAVRAEWEDLADDAGAAPFVRPDWLTIWWGAFGGGGRGRLRLAMLRAESGIQALVALVVHRGRMYSPGNAHTPWSGVIARDDGAADALLSAIFRGPAHRVTLAPIVWDSATAASARRVALETGRIVVERGSWQSPYVDLAGVAAAAELVGRRPRKELRRCARRLAEQGAVAYTVHKDPRGLDAVLDDAFQVEAAQWKGREGTAIVSRPDTEAFYRRLAHSAAAGGTLHLAALRVDAHIVAFELGVREGGRHFALKSGFHPDYRRFSPGHLLCERILDDAIAAGLRCYEMLGHNDEYKRRWANGSHRIVSLEFLSRSPRGLASYALLRAERRARALARPAARRAREALRRARRRGGA